MPSIYVPQLAAIGCDVALFEAYFGYKAKGAEDNGPTPGTRLTPCT